MSSQEYKNKIEYGVSAVVLLVGVFFIYQAFTIETSRESIGPRTLPLILAVSLVIGGAWLALRALLGKAGDLRGGYGFLESDLKRILLVVACGVLFVITFWGLGYFMAVIVTLIAMLYTFGVRNWVAMIICAVVLAFIFQWVFMGVMLLNDPKGAIVDMRPYTNWITGAK
ncbi:MAG: tripartite tricarboxylate transporter TctB family protein [Granulosicoccus sp.]|nr:tripartite tricarboxylate transporter TctB family protein [Granulosicoccus sp.]